MKTRYHLFLASLVFAFVASTSSATLLVYEGFDDAVTGNAVSVLTNGYGWAEGSYWARENAKDTLSIVADSLASGNVVGTGNKFSVSGSNGRYSNRSFEDPITPATTATLWGGVLMKATNSKSGRTVRFIVTGGGVNQLYVCGDTGSKIVVSNNTTTNTTSISTGTGVHFCLFRMDLGAANPTTSVWLDPADYSSVAALGEPTAVLANTATAVSGVRLGTSSGNPAYYDEIRFGTTLVDAWCTLPPRGNPATLLLLL